jgi:hypothetical protein
MAANSSLILPTLSQTAKLAGQTLPALVLPTLQVPMVKHDGVTYAPTTTGLLIRA